MATMMECYPSQVFVDDEMKPLVSGRLTVYNHDTNVLANIYSLEGQDYVAMDNPVRLDEAGRLGASIFAELGVYDVKIISATQYNELLSPAGNVDMGSREKHHFLNYRVENVIKGKNMRGLSEDDSHRCPLVMDDSSIAGNWHFPCSIYMREMGAPIGEVSGSMRHERILWAEQHDTHRDPICRKYCLDATRDFNNRYMYYKIKDQTVTPVLDPQAFSEEIFAEDGLIRIGAGDLCFDNAKDHRDLFLARNERAEYRLLGCCMTEDMPQCDNVENRVALMYEDNDAKRFWFVIRASEFMEMLSELQQEEHRSR